MQLWLPGDNMSAVAKISARVAERADIGPGLLPEGMLESSEPVVLRGLASAWPATQKALKSDADVAEYLRGFYAGQPVSAFVGAPEIDGRFFYNDDLSGFNFFQVDSDLRQVLDKLLSHAGDTEAPAFYVGSTAVDGWLPGFREENDLALAGKDPMVSIWLGNRSRVSAHFDFPNNIACVVAGHRRFTLFPPEQIENLYVGPMDLTPAGQQISLVDFAAPDFQRFPKFEQALAHAQVAELGPGDALFIPGMWWHHVEALDAMNVLVNYWWSTSPEFLGSPADALTHALLSIKSLPPAQRDAWRALFDYYVFEGESPDHIPNDARGRLGEIDERAARRLRAELLNRLNT